MTPRKLLSLLTVMALAGSPAFALKAGDPAPAFAVEKLGSGDRVQLDAFQGRVLLVDFWASWCGPCRQSLPVYRQLSESLADRGFSVLAVNVDAEAEEGRGLLRQLGMDPKLINAVRDDKGAVASKYGVKVMPSAYLVDRRGVVRVVHVGFKADDVPKLRAQITQLLDETP
ncbi:redoxin [Methylibium sp. Pch-M]|uniref:TlpA family protein disulfide reductase n=1 Tax=Methylibium sp. Pch-M TaxID=2082386 RepID=UPI001012ACA0|nr:TlpA disulfide reductase family protein [Methylibium sp. Pch-M]QAZ40341.1 redoxin [Methylibium sp. Pch-M]